MGEKGWSEQAINKVAEMAIATQIKGADHLTAKLKTDLNKLAKGQVDAIAIKINGLIMQHELKADEFDFQIGQVTVKPMSAMRGKIKLVHPSHGTLNLTLHEDRFTDAINSGSIQAWAKTVLAAEPVNEKASVPVVCKFIENAVTFSVTPSPETDLPAAVLVATPRITAEGRRLDWQDVRYLEGELASETTTTLLTKASEVLSLEPFEKQGTLFRVQQIDLAEGLLTLHATADIQMFPD